MPKKPVPMKPKEKYEFILSVLRPRKRKSSNPVLAAGLAALAGSNKDKNISARTFEARYELREDVHFLGGVLTLLPALNLKRYPQFQHEGESLLNDAFSFANTCKATVGSVKKMKKFGERILRLVEKIEKDLRAIIAEIINDASAKGEEGYGHLPFLDSGKPDDFYISFKQSCSIKLDALDLCAFQSNGEAKFTVGEPCPDAVIPAWKARHSKILSIVEHMLQRAKELNGKGISLKDAAGFVARCSNDKLFIPTLNLGLKTLTYNFKRVGRLRQPRAAALLSRYANFLARHAFDHDFGDQRQAAMTKPKDGLPAVVGNEVRLEAAALPRGEAIAITQEPERESQTPAEMAQTETVAEAKKDEEPPATI